MVSWRQTNVTFGERYPSGTKWAIDVPWWCSKYQVHKKSTVPFGISRTMEIYGIVDGFLAHFVASPLFQWSCQQLLRSTDCPAWWKKHNQNRATVLGTKENKGFCCHQAAISSDSRSFGCTYGTHKFCSLPDLLCRILRGLSNGRITLCAPKSRSGTLAKFCAMVWPVTSTNLRDQVAVSFPNFPMSHAMSCWQLRSSCSSNSSQHSDFWAVVRHTVPENPSKLEQVLHHSWNAANAMHILLSIWQVGQKHATVHTFAHLLIHWNPEGSSSRTVLKYLVTWSNPPPFETFHSAWDPQLTPSCRWSAGSHQWSARSRQQQGVIRKLLRLLGTYDYCHHNSNATRNAPPPWLLWQASEGQHWWIRLTKIWDLRGGPIDGTSISLAWKPAVGH